MDSTQVRCAHLLQKHTKSRNPNDSYRKKPITRSPEEALANIVQFRKDIMASEKPALKFQELAAQFSECGSAAKSGDLGLFGKGDMQQPFEDASFSLKVGEISDVVNTDSGYHLILRLG